ncbi:transposase, partial [Methylococcaceae bacterium CS5]
GIDQDFLDILQQHTAGNPMNSSIRWTYLKPREIVSELLKKGYSVSRNIVRYLLKKHEYVKRKAQKNITMGGHPDRNAQFENITQLKQDYLDAGNPVISMDTKKKELLGTFYRNGSLYTQAAIQTNDHDFPSSATGSVIPHGFYDLKRNTGYITLGTSHDTSEFACDSLFQWWVNEGIIHYPKAKSLLILCDGGGSNSSRHYIFKEDLQKTANALGLEIRIAHYPPYTSKYNPIEHRFFPHVTRACEGVVVDSVETVKTLISRTSTSKGLTTIVHILDKIYETGRKYAADFKEIMPIVFDTHLPKWNYRAIPQE